MRLRKKTKKTVLFYFAAFYNLKNGAELSESESNSQIIKPNPYEIELGCAFHVFSEEGSNELQCNIYLQNEEQALTVISKINTRQSNAEDATIQGIYATFRPNKRPNTTNFKLQDIDVFLKQIQPGFFNFLYKKHTKTEEENIKHIEQAQQALRLYLRENISVYDNNKRIIDAYDAIMRTTKTRQQALEPHYKSIDSSHFSQSEFEKKEMETRLKISTSLTDDEEKSCDSNLKELQRITSKNFRIVWQKNGAVTCEFELSTDNDAKDDDNGNQIQRYDLSQNDIMYISAHHPDFEKNLARKDKWLEYYDACFLCYDTSTYSEILDPKNKARPGKITRRNNAKCCTWQHCLKNKGRVCGYVGTALLVAGAVISFIGSRVAIGNATPQGFSAPETTTLSPINLAAYTRLNTSDAFYNKNNKNSNNNSYNFTFNNSTQFLDLHAYYDGFIGDARVNAHNTEFCTKPNSQPLFQPCADEPLTCIEVANLAVASIQTTLMNDLCITSAPQNASLSLEINVHAKHAATHARCYALYPAFWSNTDTLNKFKQWVVGGDNPRLVTQLDFSSTTPTDAPTKAPTDAPTDIPTKAPTDVPTKAPTDAPTDVPTKTPTDAPTKAPTPPSSTVKINPCGQINYPTDFPYPVFAHCDLIEGSGQASFYCALARSVETISVPEDHCATDGNSQFNCNGDEASVAAAVKNIFVQDNNLAANTLTCIINNGAKIVAAILQAGSGAYFTSKKNGGEVSAQPTPAPAVALAPAIEKNMPSATIGLVVIGAALTTVGAVVALKKCGFFKPKHPYRALAADPTPTYSDQDNATPYTLIQLSR